MNATRLIIGIFVLVTAKCFCADQPPAREEQTIPLFPNAPTNFERFDLLGKSNAVGKGQVAFRFCLSPLKGEKKEAYLLAIFSADAIAGIGDLECHVEYQIYTANHLVKHRILDLGHENAESLLNAIDKSEIFGLSEMQQRRRLSIDGELVIAEQIESSKTRSVSRCDGASAPMEYIVTYLRSHFCDDL